MKVNFIGQGLNENAEKNVGKILCSAFTKSHFYSKFIGLTAFATNSGISKIISYISDAKSSFEKIVFYIGVNDQVTTREALQNLLDNEIETYIFFIEDKLFHPKVYIFEGKTRNKIIVGSSNLTRPGLFLRNIESSVELDYDNSDSSGKKFRNQINEYFSQLFDNSHSNLKLLTSEYLNELVEKEIVRDESFWFKKNKYEDDRDFVGNLPKRKKRTEDNIGDDLGNVKDDKRRKSPTSKTNNRLIITDEYLRTWSFYFEELKKYKEANGGSTIVSKNHPDKYLYRWYAKQKTLYNNLDENGKRLIPPLHEEALENIGFFWKDGNILRKLKIWEGHLQKSIIYSKSKNLPYTWVIWEKKDPKFPYKREAEWCWEQRMRLNGTMDKPLGDYEKKRLKDAKFLEKSENEGGILQEDSFIEKLIELSELKTKRITNGKRKWLPSQTDADPKVAELGNWLNDKIEWIKQNLNNSAALAREKDLNDLGIDVRLGYRKTNFEIDAEEYTEMRKKFPFDNPKGEERKPYKAILDWEATNKNRYNEFPEWRQKRLVELKIVTPKYND